MNSVRLWIAILALVCFGVGLATGLWVAARVEPRFLHAGPFEDYARLCAQTFDLSQERRAALGEVLELYSRDIEAVQRPYLARAGSEMERELELVGLRYRDLIRDHVLPVDQRPRFDQLAQGKILNPGE